MILASAVSPAISIYRLGMGDHGSALTTFYAYETQKGAGAGRHGQKYTRATDPLAAPPTYTGAISAL